MKKIFILLAAAVAALSSCVEENALAPETKEGNVTIKAVSADSKTLLDGTDVVWENTDKIAVVLDDKDVTTVEFSVKGEANGANATFTGTIEPELEYTSAYAVYPASAVVDGVVSHTLPEVQTGVVTSGMNLSSALLDAAQLQAGEAVGTFHNALVLLQVVVPAGMQEISLTSDEYLVGPTDFYVTNGVLSRKTVESATVTLKTGSELTAGTHSLLVYPVKGGLTIYMKGTDGTEYTKAVDTPNFEASKYYTLDFTKVFNMQTTEVMAASPAGEELVVPIVSVNDYTYSVSVEGNPDWITYTLPTKGFHGEEIVFNVKKNDSGVERSANVTISWGDESTRTFTITQKPLFMDFVEDAEGNPIQWEETFSVYASENDAFIETYTNVFTIDTSDDFSKGAYKVSNIFKLDLYFGDGYQQIYDKGGVYYADYIDGNLIIKMKGAIKSYNFLSDVVLAYDSINKTFSASSLAFGQTQGSSIANVAGYIGNYTATVKVETPVESEDPYVGTWDITYEDGGSAGSTWLEKEGTMTIELEGDVYKITDFAGIAVDWQLSQTDNVFSYNAQGTTLTLTYDEEKAQFTTSSGVTIWSYMSSPMFCFRNLVATKPGAEANPLESLNGSSWDQVCVHNQSMMEYMLSSTMTISIADNQVTLSDFFVTGTTAVGTLSGSDITIPSGTKIKNAGTLDSDAILTISQDGETITSTGFSCGSGWWVVSEYTATISN